MIFIPILLALFISFFSPNSVFAAQNFTVTGFDGSQHFTWTGVPLPYCSASNSYVLTYPEKNHQTPLFNCTDTYGDTVGPIPDGEYTIFLAIEGQAWESQIFSIKNGGIITTIPTPTPTPFPKTINHPPIAHGGTSIDTHGNIVLDGSLSSDQDHDSLSYRWNIDGIKQARNGEYVSISDLPDKTYQVSLTVFDSKEASEDTFLLAVKNSQRKPTVAMKVDKFNINKKSGEFSLQGNFDTRSPLLNTLINNPLGEISLALQTDYREQNPVFGFVGDAQYQFKSLKNELK